MSDFNPVIYESEHFRVTVRARLGYAYVSVDCKSGDYSVASFYGEVSPRYRFLEGRRLTIKEAIESAFACVAKSEAALRETLEHVGGALAFAEALREVNALVAA
jgi:hypothetical protein